MYKKGRYCVIEDNVKIGKNTVIGDFCRILSGSVIGNNCSFSAYCEIRNDCVIGDNVIMGSRCTLSAGTIVEDNVNIKYSTVITDTPNLSVEDYKITGVIKENAKIGANVTIMPGIIIGKNTIIGACSQVRHNVPDNEIWYGNPAKFFKKV